jgi:hypothetical protein
MHAVDIHKPTYWSTSASVSVGDAVRTGPVIISQARSFCLMDTHTARTASAKIFSASASAPSPVSVSFEERRTVAEAAYNTFRTLGAHGACQMSDTAEAMVITRGLHTLG